MVGQLPNEPGIYFLKDEAGKTIYVGKSANIRKRVKSHFRQGKDSVPVAKVYDIDYIATDSELEALILECNFIKRLRPLYNARLKDDKSYPYIKITKTQEYPGIYISRVVRDDGNVYLGPYADVGSARRSIKILRQIFPIRTCRRRMDRTSHPCLDYHIRRCAGPCTGRVDPKDYATNVEGMIKALEGRKQELLEEVRKSMYAASETQDYERAAVLRNRLDALEKTILRQRLSRSSPGNMDILGLAVKDDHACVQVLFVRDGAIIDQEHFILESAGENRSELLTSFVKEYYSNNQVPPLILTDVAFDDIQVMGSWFQLRSESVVGTRTPSERDERHLVSMASRNAELMLKLERRMMGESFKKGLQDLARALDMVCLPKVIEAFDLSNMSGKSAVGSMVRFRWGKPNRSLYRRFRIGRSPGRDDYGMMREIVERRFKRAVDIEQVLPDLILVDGGPGQASAAEESLRSLGIRIPVVGLAKRYEEIYLPGSYKPVSIQRGSQAHILLRRIRDEAHRFAISYHRILRQREITRSGLDAIRGIGPKRKADLLKRFGSVERIRRSDAKEIARIPGINDELANKVLDHLRGRARGRVS